MKQAPFPKDMTIGDKYRPAMEIQDQEEADNYFKQCVRHTMMHGEQPMSQEEAERIERINLGYFAGYYGPETRERVERLFNCSHPVFGKVAEVGTPSTDTALLAGMMSAAGVPTE
jgi:hypothetical protein